MKTNPTNPIESAFPEVQAEPQFNHFSYGLTKREYFAAMAMQSFSYDKDARARDEPTELFYTKAAIASVRMADALIKELNNPTP